MQEPLQPTVAERVMRNIHSLAVLAEELGAFAHGQVPEDDLRVILILTRTGLADMHPKLQPGPDTRRSHAGLSQTEEHSSNR
jgi:hypothetical protein